MYVFQNDIHGYLNFYRYILRVSISENEKGQKSRQEKSRPTTKENC